MRLTKARIRGFQSFSDSGDVEFLDGINLIIGQNNAGKSSLLRALLVSLPDDRHRSPGRWQNFSLPRPEVDLTVEVKGVDIREWFLRTTHNIQHFPLLPEQVGQGGERFIQEIFDRSALPLSVTSAPGVGFYSAQYPSHQLFAWSPGGQQACIGVTAPNGKLKFTASYNGQDSLPGLLYEAWQRDMFYFAAERMTIGEAPSGNYANRLLPNASNLPNVLQALSGERGDVFRQLIHHLREVFQGVGNLSVRTKPSGAVLEVLVWPTEAMERSELGFPLNSSGTGVAQVIALLAAIMTIDEAIIIIDEISSFLHPAAAKALLRIIQTRYAQHQYIISTHSPEVISFSNPATIHLLTRVEYDTSVKQLAITQVDTFREVADHLGVSMADVFAADRVIWVEGPTEELCFPYLYQQLVGPLPRGTIFTSVAATGDFNKKRRDSEIVYEVYTRLSAATATLVVSVAFSFDTELLTEEQKRKMQRESGGLLHFLPRRHFECYLVNPAAIAAFIISKDPSSTELVTPAAVELAIKDAASEHPLRVREWTGDINDHDWLARIDAANLIKTVCNTLSDNRAPFAKKADSSFLLRHVLEHNRERITQLKEYVSLLVEAARQR